MLAEVDYHEYGMNLLKSGTSLEGMTKEDVLYNDFKMYTINELTKINQEFILQKKDGKGRCLNE